MKIFILFLLILTGCSSKKESHKNFERALNYSGEKNPLAFLYQTDTLKLTATFSECGEFGGHNEKIQIFGNYKKEYFARITKDSIDLDCPNDFEAKAVIVQDTIVRIDNSKEKKILKYLNLLYKRSIEGKAISHSNDYFRATTNYAGLSLSTAEPNKDWNEFRKLHIELLK